MDIQHIKLFHFPVSRSPRVKWLLHELLGDRFEVEVLALYEGQQYHPEHLDRNPNHGVPVLELTQVDGAVVTMIESGAMISLLADLYPDKRLAPPPAQFSMARLDYLQMLHFGASSVDMMLWQLRLHLDLLPQSERDDRTISRYREKLAAEVEPQLEARLERCGYISGDKFTAADCIMGHNVIWARMYGLCSAAVFTRYLARLAERPAYRAAFADRDRFRRSPTG